jgi:membrane-bound lytic murein transglycosylase D
VFLKEKMKKRDLLVVTNLNAKQFELLNPVYIAEALHPHPTIPILLPAALETVFRLSEDSLYAAFCLKTDTAEKANDNKNAIQVISSANYQTIPAQPEYIIYSVKQGDMLGRIAEKHGVSLKKLKKWNKLKGDIIHPGQKLKIYK